MELGSILKILLTLKWKFKIYHIDISFFLKNLTMIKVSLVFFKSKSSLLSFINLFECDLKRMINVWMLKMCVCVYNMCVFLKEWREDLRIASMSTRLNQSDLISVFKEWREDLRIASMSTRLNQSDLISNNVMTFLNLRKAGIP